MGLIAPVQRLILGSSGRLRELAPRLSVQLPETGCQPLAAFAKTALFLSRRLGLLRRAYMGKRSAAWACIDWPGWFVGRFEPISLANL